MAFPSLSDYKRYIEENRTNKTAVTDTSKTTRQTPATYQDSAGYVKKRIAKAVEILNAVPDELPLNRVSETPLNAASIELLKAERSILRVFSEPEDPAPYRKIPAKSAIPDDFCAVSTPDHALISIRFKAFLPPYHYEWYSRKSKEKDGINQYYLDAEFDFLTEAAIKKFMLENGPVTVPSGHLYLIFLRGIAPNSPTVIDNNNVYTGAITNAVSRALWHGDGWQLMSYLYTAKSDQNGPYLDVILCEKCDIMYWLEA